MPEKPKVAAGLGPAQDDDFFMAPVKAARQRQAAPTLINPLTDNTFNTIKSIKNNNINQFNGPKPSADSPFTPQEFNFLTYYIIDRQSK